MNWNRFAAVNDEFHSIHMDDEAGRAAGNPSGAFGMGNLRYAYLINALRTWFGDEAFIAEVSCQYRAINQKGDRLTVRGVITGVSLESSKCTVDLELDVINQVDESTCPGRARLILSIA